MKFIPTGKDGFIAYERDDLLVTWVDALGTRDLNGDDLMKRTRKLIQIASEATSTGRVENEALHGDTNTKAQFSIVGDAIVLVQNRLEDDLVAKMPLLLCTMELSKLLFDAGIPHRGVVNSGHVVCEATKFGNIITGEAVVKAFNLEQKIQSTGIFAHESAKAFYTEFLPEMGESYYDKPDALRKVVLEKYGPAGNSIAHDLWGVLYSNEQAIAWRKATKELTSRHAIAAEFLLRKIPE